MNSLTAWIGLMEMARLRPGKQDAVRALGASLALDYSVAGWERDISANVVLEMTGGRVYRVPAHP